MDIRVLEYFLAVAREQNISKAAEKLHVSQPALSVQLRNLEAELGKPLLIRGSKGSRRISLTEEGMILRKRAEQILNLVSRTEEEISSNEADLSGTISISAGESLLFEPIARTMRLLRLQHPGIRFDVISGIKSQTEENLERGISDFGVVFGEVDSVRYESLPIPGANIWGVVLPSSHPLAARKNIRAEEILHLPLILPSQPVNENKLPGWLSVRQEQIAATYSLAFNGFVMVRAGLGVMLALDGLFDPSDAEDLVFIPLEPAVKASMSLIWKKFQVLSKPAIAYIETCRDLLEADSSNGLIRHQDEPAANE